MIKAERPREGVTMKFKLSSFLFVISLSLCAKGVHHDFSQIKASKDVIITTGSDVVAEILDHIDQSKINVLDKRDDISLVRLPEAYLPLLSELMHEKFMRCGGFIRHDDLNEGKTLLYSDAKLVGEKGLFANYDINQGALVERMIEEVKEESVRAIIEKLSGFKNRYYKSKHGVQSSQWLIDHWKSLSAHRKDVVVSKWEHSRWPQPSVLLTLKGQSDEIIVVGGHADSISGWFGRAEAKAPGADDNASGMATITEIIRVLMNSNYRPEKTIVFMGYAAEEVGLLGSKEIAKKFKKDGKNVIATLQLDMTNFNGSELDIVMMTDFTNRDQNQFIGALIDEYLPGISWGYDKCGYACSDHASWNGQGFPASMPFESAKRDMNKKIHTRKDTIGQSQGNANHASKFAKMGLAFVVELDR
jgi:bacterial leucyl aminopeptidase